MTIPVTRLLAAWLTAAFIASAVSPAAALDLQPGEYACYGSSGILIGLGFKFYADGSYTDLDGKSKGRVVFSGATFRFVGGHLDGQIGRDIRKGTQFNLAGHGISCERQR